MAAYLLAALILVPLIEIAVFIEVGGLIGALPTIALVILISVAGTWLLRRQGLDTLRKAQSAMNAGEMPVGEVVDGLFIVFAALLMITPGLLTDAIGLVLLVPSIRRHFGAAALRWLMRHAEVRFSSGPAGPAPWEKAGEGRGPIIEGEAEVVEPEGRPDPQSRWLVQDEPDKRK